jgi:hypothetical protein
VCPLPDGLEYVACEALVLSGRKVLVGITDVEHVMWNSLTFRQGRFCRSDIHSAVDLESVATDDLAADLPCEGDAELGLAGAGCAENRQRWMRPGAHGHPSLK